MPDDKKFEDALMKVLSQGRMDKAKLAVVSSAIVALKKQGFEIDQVNIKGRVQPDRVIVNGIPFPDFIRKFQFPDLPIRVVKLFPYGIINPEWRTQFEFGI
jgi:hypothetical protein